MQRCHKSPKGELLDAFETHQNYSMFDVGTVVSPHIGLRTNEIDGPLGCLAVVSDLNRMPLQVPNVVGRL